jgi:hypothetical protein
MVKIIKKTFFVKFHTETIILVCPYRYFNRKIRIVQNFRIVQFCTIRKNKTKVKKF